MISSILIKLIPIGGCHYWRGRFKTRSRLITSNAKSNHEKQVKREKLVIIPCSQMTNINLNPSRNPDTNQRFICHVLTLMDLIRFRAWIKI